ncbi:MAG: Gfo/Idh/MocA family oxidoreductase [Clostridiales bacterium]|nr:Gfo/Idh/MocA family oxidoreductase [Clostridiales bacterium]
MIKAGIIGCGSIARFRHAPEYAANGNARIAGFFDPVTERARELADLYGGRVYGSAEELLADGAVDAVSVCAHNAAHCGYTVDALAAGKHVLCEKPMAVTADEARRMIRARDRAGKILMVGHNQRLLQANKIAKELIDGGTLGRVLTVTGAFGHAGPEGWSRDGGAETWFFQKGKAGFGVTGDLGIHKFDLARYLAGGEAATVYADFRTADKTYGDGSRIGVEDNAFVILGFDNGVAAQIHLSWTHYGGEDNATRVCLTGGVVKLFGEPNRPLVVVKRDGETRSYDAAGIQTNGRQTASGVIDEFIDSVLTGRKPAVTGEDGLAALEIAEACARSAAEKRPIELKKVRG